MKKNQQQLLPVPPQLLFNVIHSASDVIIVADQKRRIVFANHSACEKTGFQHGELLGKNIAALYSKENQAKYISRILQGIQKHGRWSGEIELRRKNGTPLWIDTKIYAFYDDDGKIAGRIGIGRDLSDRRLLGQHQWESDGHLLTVIESMEDAVCVCDAQGKIVMCNEAHCRMLGYCREEIIGVQPPYPWVDQVDHRKLRYGFRILLKEGKLKNYTISWHRHDESTLVVSLAFSPMKDISGSISGMVITARDITDVQYVEELRRTNERMQRLISDVQRKAERLQTLEAVNSLVLKNTDIGRIFRSVVAGIKKLVQHDLAGIYVYDSDHESLLPHTLSKQTQFSRRLAKFPLPLGEGIIGAAAISGRMVLANNAQLDPRSKYPEGMKPDREHFIAVPLQGRGSIFGVLVVARNSDPEFIEEEALIVKSFADATTVALENARLFWELNKHQHGLAQAVVSHVGREMARNVSAPLKLPGERGRKRIPRSKKTGSALQ
ncbi:MAG: PAS domain-containing protein [Ignavibacteriae bacterium]|nr:PAS domain-containing protein [Ignavibacteria bacterium]MBI3364912.1 PAS domain-containing protein [Ignavibacteriota bacterium]